MELMLLVAEAVLPNVAAAVVVTTEADVEGSDDNEVVVVIVAVVTAAVTDEDDDEVATPTISDISSENSREGENWRVGLKLISRPSSVRGECNGVILWGLVRLDGDAVEEVDFVEEAVVVFCGVCWTCVCVEAPETDG